MSTFISPTGNSEEWENKPEGYFTQEEWDNHLYDGISIEKGKEIVKAQITNKRWEMETGGVTLPNDIKVSSTVADQNRIATSIQGMELSGISKIDFKSDSGWIQLSLDDLKELSVAITHHVETCFARECVLHKRCDEATTINELKRILEHDMLEGWLA